MKLLDWFSLRWKARRCGACLRFPELRPAGLVAFQPSAGKPAPTDHGEPPQVRLTTRSWQQPQSTTNLYALALRRDERLPRDAAFQYNPILLSLGKLRHDPDSIDARLRACVHPDGL